MAVDLKHFQEVMSNNMVKIILLGVVLIIGNLLFKKFEEYLKGKRKS